MSPQSESKGMLWSGRVITTLVVLFMLFDSITKVLKLPMVVEPSAKVGITANMIFWIGATLLVSTILYAIPHTSVLGAILVSPISVARSAQTSSPISPRPTPAWPSLSASSHGSASGFANRTFAAWSHSEANASASSLLRPCAWPPLE